MGRLANPSPEAKANKAAYDLARRLADPERKREEFRKYYRSNRAKVIAKNRAWALQNHDKWTAYVSAWWAAHPELRREYAAAFRAANPLSQRERSQRRRARLVATIATLTLTEWQEILTEFDHHCAYCDASGIRLEIEHLKPLARGGQHTKGNVVPACRRCNARKGTKTLFEFLRSSSSPTRKESFHD